MGQAEQSQKDIYEHPPIAPQDFVKDDYVHLWEYFSDRADVLKDRLWAMATWLLGFNSAILAFIFGTQLITFDSSGSVVRAPGFVLALALAGCGLCLNALLLITDYGKHIQRNWDRGDVLKAKLPLVEEALAGSSSTGTEQKDGNSSGLRKIGLSLKANLPFVKQALAGQPKIAQYLYGFALAYLGVFLIIAAFTIIVMIST